MSTQIIDNFKVNVAKPIDNRMVTTGSASRDSIQYKYEGLRVFDTSDKVAYVYLNGAWVSESSASGTNNIGISGTQYSLLYFNTSSTVASSKIYDKSSGSNILIGIGQANPSFALDVSGDVNAVNYHGNGAQITNINPKNIIGDSGFYTPTQNTNKLNVAYLTNGNIGQVLTTTSNGPTWVDNSGVANKISVLNDSTNTLRYLTFVDITDPAGNQVYFNKENTAKAIAVNSLNSQLLVSSYGSNNETLPGYSFINYTSTGIYGNSANLGFSFNAIARLVINSTTLRILDPSGSNVLTSASNGINFGSATGNNPFIVAQTSGSQTSPDYTWLGDLTTGIYRSAISEISFTSNGVKKASINTTGLVINSAFKLTSGNLVNGNVLVSDAYGTGTWQTLLTGVPYGTVVMWLSVASIPTGWKVCLASGDTRNYIFLNNSNGGGYYQIPDMRDSLIAGDTTMTNTWNKGGTNSPSSAISLLASNLPPHTHPLSNTNAKFTFSGTPLANHNHPVQTRGLSFNSGGTQVMTDQSGSYDAGQITGDASAGTPAGTISVNSGSTTDLGPTGTQTALPINKYVGMIFIIKYNPNATQDTVGYCATSAEYNTFMINNGAFGNQTPPSNPGSGGSGITLQGS